MRLVGMKIKIYEEEFDGTAWKVGDKCVARWEEDSCMKLWWTGWRGAWLWSP